MSKCNADPIMQNNFCYTMKTIGLKIKTELKMVGHNFRFPLLIFTSRCVK